MGSRYLVFRVAFELQRKLGWMERIYPSSERASQKYFGNKELLKSIPTIINQDAFKGSGIQSHENLKEFIDRLKSGDFLFFSRHWYHLGNDYNWVDHPITKVSFPKVHWSKIRDLDPVAGDIKYVWEKSRFSYFISILRYDVHFKKDSSDYIFSEMDHWIQENPINIGPNWRCSQEISLRLMNWSFILQHYREHPALTEQRWRVYQNVIYWHLHHIYQNINFSRIAVRNNHAITECGMLMISHWLFPFIPETKVWSQKGKKWFEQEILFQFEQDGSYLQYSMNYQRVVIQLFSLFFRVAQVKGETFRKEVLEKAYAGLNFLIQNMGSVSTGEMPNFGPNDGAWFFPWSSTDYCDFRPQLNALHRLLTGKWIYEDDFNLLEEGQWLVDEQVHYGLCPIKLHMGIQSFPDGGYHTFRTTRSFTFIRCGTFKHRPHQSDQLHIDLWVDDKNLLVDAGSYLYNTQKDMLDYFTGSKGHNTVTLDGKSHMLKGNRFIWFNWTKCLTAEIREENEQVRFHGSIMAFGYMKTNVIIRRDITIDVSRMIWEVSDRIINYNGKIEQNWHVNTQNANEVHLEGTGPDFKAQINSGWISRYYGDKEPVNWWVYSGTDKLTTKISVK